MSDKNIRILIQNLPIIIDPNTNELITVDKDWIFSLLSNYDVGPEDIKIVAKTNSDGQQFAYALVKFDDLYQAKSAISDLNFSMFDDSIIYCKLLNNKTIHILNSGAGKILIKNLSPEINAKQLYNALISYGEVIDCIVPSNNKKSYLYGVVQFRNQANAQKAIDELNGARFNDVQVEILPLYQEKCSNIDELCKNWKELLVFSGTNNFHQLFFKSNNKQADEEIIMPPISSPLSISYLSYSIYYSHSVNILKSTIATAIGDNSKHQINNFNLQVFSYYQPISVKQTKKNRITNFISAVCGSNYTLYLCLPKLQTDNQLLALNSPEQEKSSKILDIEDRIPISLYGGEFVSAAIDKEGSVIIINNNEPLFASLPGNKKAIQLACMNLCVIALSNDGFLYELSLISSKKNFVLIKIKNNVKFSYISGTSEHCLAVSNKGEVFVRGNNEFGQLGLQSDESIETGFKLLKPFTENKIIMAFAGRDHSLFVDEKGAVFACGRNNNGELLASEEFAEKSYNSPIATTVKNGAKFCIAGAGLSVVFQFSEPPPMTPNKKIESHGQIAKEIKQIKKAHFASQAQAQQQQQQQTQPAQEKKVKQNGGGGKQQKDKKAKDNKKKTVDDDDVDDVVADVNSKTSKIEKQKQSQSSNASSQTQKNRDANSNVNEDFDYFLSEIRSEFKQIIDQACEQDKFLNQLLSVDNHSQLTKTGKKMKS